MPGPELGGDTFPCESCDGYWDEQDRGNEWPGQCIYCVAREVEGGRTPTAEESQRLEALADPDFMAGRAPALRDHEGET